MSESWSGKAEEIKARLRDAVRGDEGELDVDTATRRLRAAVADLGSDIDTEALVAKVKDAAGQAGDKIDSGRLRQWVDEVDTGRLRDWLGEAKTMAAGAAAVAEKHGERLAEHAPGAFDKLIGAAKEKLGEVTGNEEMAREGELDRLKGQIKEKYADAAAVEDDAAAIENAVDR